MTCLWCCQQDSKGDSQSLPDREDWFYWAVEYHPSKEQFIVGGSNDTFLRIYSSKNFQLLKNIPFKGTITKTKWHPSQNKIAISVQDGKSKPSILDLDTNENFELDSITMDGARAIGWNHTGDLLAVGDYEGFLTIFDHSGEFVTKIDTDQKSIIGLDWHPNNNLIAAVGEKIILYDFESDKLRYIEDREEEVLMLCVDWHPNGRFFVTGDYGDFIEHYPPLLQIWTIDGQRIKSIEESESEYRNIEWSNDGELLATASEKIRLWNVDGNLVDEKATESLLWGIDWSKDGRQLVATDESGNVIMWDRSLTRLMELQR